MWRGVYVCVFGVGMVRFVQKGARGHNSVCACLDGLQPTPRLLPGDTSLLLLPGVQPRPWPSSRTTVCSVHPAPPLWGAWVCRGTAAALSIKNPGVKFRSGSGSGGVTTVWVPEPRHAEAILSDLCSSYLLPMRRTKTRRLLWGSPPADISHVIFLLIIYYFNFTF